MLAVQSHDARVVHHLDQDQHGVLVLHDLVVVVVEQRDHWRAGAGAEGEDAALSRANALPVHQPDRCHRNGTPPNGAAIALLRFGRSGGTLPFGGSTTIDVRVSPLIDITFVPGSTQKLL